MNKYMKANSKSINGIKENKNAMIQMLPAVAIAIVMLYAIMYIGTYINGTIGSQLNDTLGSAPTGFDLKTSNTLNNLSGDYDDNTEIVSIAAIITVLKIPLMAVVAVKRLI